jgi:hypothetical protein
MQSALVTMERTAKSLSRLDGKKKKKSKKKKKNQTIQLTTTVFLIIYNQTIYQRKDLLGKRKGESYIE